MHFAAPPLPEEPFFLSGTTEEPLRDHVITEDSGIRAVIGERALADAAVAT